MGNSNLKAVKIMKIQNSLRERIRNLDVYESNLLVGTGASELFLIKNFRKDGLNKQGEAILNGHFMGETWGLTTHP